MPVNFNEDDISDEKMLSVYRVMPYMLDLPSVVPMVMEGYKVFLKYYLLVLMGKP